MKESEKITRRNRIDARLKSSLLDWEIIHSSKVTEPSQLTRHAVEEFPTATGPADYALFVDGILLGITFTPYSQGVKAVSGHEGFFKKKP